MREFQRAFARYGLYFCAWLFTWLPYALVRMITNVLIELGFIFTVRQKRIALESLQIAFGTTKTPEELRRIIRSCFVNLGQGMIELLYFMAHPKAVHALVRFEGREYLDAAIKKGKGVIAVTAHFGNFPLMMLSCAAEGYTVNAIIRPTRDVKLEKFLFKKRLDAGLKTVYAIPPRQSVVSSLKVLRDNEMLFIPLDQNFGRSGGVFVDFFGQKAATATGPMVFAKRTGAEILLMFALREQGDRHRVVIEPFVIEERSTEEETIEYNIARITHRIEEYIRRYPYEWGWMHRRWKTQQESAKSVSAADDTVVG